MKLLILFILSSLILTSPVLAYEVKESTDKYTYKIDIYETPFPNVNKKIKDWLDEKLEEFKQYENYNEIKNDFYTDYELHEYNGIYYLQYFIYSYTGGVHYFLINNQFTYNKRGEILELKDFFNNDNYLEILSKLFKYSIILLSLVLYTSNFSVSLISPKSSKKSEVTLKYSLDNSSLSLTLFLI